MLLIVLTFLVAVAVLKLNVLIHVLLSVLILLVSSVAETLVLAPVITLVTLSVHLKLVRISAKLLV